MIDNDTVFALADHFRLQWEEKQDCHVLLFPEGMIRLNESAAEVLKQVDGNRSVQEIIDVLHSEFPDQKIDEDVKNFLGDANEHGWITKNSH